MTAARAADRALDAGIAAFAAWTVVYHVCLVSRLGAGWALGGWIVLLALGALAWRRMRPEREAVAAPAVASRRPAARAWSLAALVATAVLAVAAGAALGTGAPYLVVWPLWLLAAACALARAALRAPARADDQPSGSRRPELAVVAAFAVGLAVLSLFLDNPDPDDAFYVHQSAWIGAHGLFPLRDVVYSGDRLPALYFPPAFSFEALSGAIAWLTGLRAADVVYFAVPPLGSVLAVLALWRLLRTWRVALPALALTAALVFLLFDAGLHMSFGAFFVSRMWQGKVLLLTILLPLLLARLHAQARSPSRRGLLALTLTGAAAVGLSTTAIFVVPVVAVGALAPTAVRAPRRAAAALAAACAYPVGAGVVTKLVGGRTPDVYTASEVRPSNLLHLTLGSGGMALLVLTALLLAPALLPRPMTAAMVAGIALLVGLLLAPGVPRVIFDLSGLGRVLWRLTWAIPVAASVGALAVGVAGRRGPPLLRSVPGVLVCVALAAFGTPLWSRASGTRVASKPVLKREARQLTDARAVLARARPGDVVLAVPPLSQTLLVLSGRITTVTPRPFFTQALAGQPEMHAAARLRLEGIASHGLASRPPSRREIASLRRDLRLVGVDLACVPRDRIPIQHALRAAGLRPAFGTGHIACLRRPAT